MDVGLDSKLPSAVICPEERAVSPQQQAISSCSGAILLAARSYGGNAAFSGLRLAQPATCLPARALSMNPRVVGTAQTSADDQ